MTVQITDIYAVPDIFADGIGDVHIAGGVVRLSLWQWIDGNRVRSGRLMFTKEGLIASRPLITAALDQVHLNRNGVLIAH